MKKLIILIGLVTTCVSAFAQLEEVFVTDGFARPESIVWDKSRNVFYVSNYHQNVENGTSYGDDYVSKVDVNGKIIELEWIKHLSAPTGVIVANDKLYIVERFGVSASVVNQRLKLGQLDQCIIDSYHAGIINIEQ